MKPSAEPSLSASPKPHPSKPHPCNMPQAKTEVALQFSESCAAATFAFLQCRRHFYQKPRCNQRKLHCNIGKAALQESGALLQLSCGSQAPTFRLPRLGPTDSYRNSRVPQNSGEEGGARTCLLISFDSCSLKISSNACWLWACHVRHCMWRGQPI